MGKAVALLLSPASTYLEKELRKRFELEHLHRQGSTGLVANADVIEVVVTNGKTGCAGGLIETLPKLRMIAIHGVGFDRVDLRAARARRIAVSHTPGVLTADVADLAVGLVIALMRQIPAADRHVRDGRWPDREFPLSTRVSRKRFGILGLGRIGEAIAQRLSAFGPIAYTATRAKPVSWDFHPDVVSLAAASDVLVVACAANERTRSLVGEEALLALGPGGYLINVARGEIVDEAALSRMLESGRLAGAALDVFLGEPSVSADLRGSDRTLLTPHIGSATAEARKQMADMVLANLDAFLAGRPLPNELPLTDR